MSIFAFNSESKESTTIPTFSEAKFRKFIQNLTFLVSGSGLSRNKYLRLYLKQISAVFPCKSMAML